MEFLSEISRTWSSMGLPFPRGSPWGCTLAYGTPITGQQEVDWWRLTGARRRSLLPTGIIRQKRAFGRRGGRDVGPWGQPQIAGLISSWTWAVRGGWGGCRRSIWSITIALMWSDSLRGFHQNACIRNLIRSEEFRFQKFYVFYIKLITSL